MHIRNYILIGMFGAFFYKKKIQYYFHWPEEKYFKKKINYLYTFLFYYNLFITDTTYIFVVVLQDTQEENVHSAKIKREITFIIKKLLLMWEFYLFYMFIFVLVALIFKRIINLI